MNKPDNRQFIGHIEMVTFPDAGVKHVPAKVDTGAYRCSIWASKVEETPEGLSFVLFGKSSPHYNGKVVIVEEYTKAMVRNSFGHREERYKVRLRIKVGKMIYKTDFTLANRSINRYPVLLGRGLLRKRFVVDVTEKNVHYTELNNKL
jgi:hypothetical protein